MAVEGVSGIGSTHRGQSSADDAVKHIEGMIGSTLKNIAMQQAALSKESEPKTTVPSPTTSPSKPMGPRPAFGGLKITTKSSTVASSQLGKRKRGNSSSPVHFNEDNHHDVEEAHDIPAQAASMIESHSQIQAKPSGQPQGGSSITNLI